jgi:hypothetical protein
MTLHVAATLLTLATLGADITVQPLAGEPVRGRLSALSVDSIAVETNAGLRTLATSEVLDLQLPAERLLDKPTVWVELLDGSKLLAEGYTAAAGKASVQLVGGPKVEIPTRSIVSVRLRQQDADLATQWKTIISAERTADLIVVRKTSMRMVEEGGEPQTLTETALDELDGTLLDVGPESVKFNFGGDEIDVKREKIEGLVYYHAVARQLPPPACRLTDVGGSQWSVRTVKLAGDHLAIATSAGVSVELPLSGVTRIDFSIGNIAPLVDLEPDTGDGEPVVSLQPAAMTAKFGRLFKVSRLPPLGADGFRIANKRYDSGLSLHSPATLVYRVPEGFRKLHAVAGVDDSIVAPGDFVLRIIGDGKELFRHEFSGSEQRGPVTIDVDLAGVRRFSIVLDPADGQDFGDQLNLCEARLTK